MLVEKGIKSLDISKGSPVDLFKLLWKITIQKLRLIIPQSIYIYQWLRRLCVYLFLFDLLIILSLFYFFPYFGLFNNDMDSARYMVSALVQCEAAIIAIVVTLSLVAVQLAAQSYSSRIVDVFKKNPDFWILLGIYFIAMIYGLGVLKLIKAVNPNALSNIENHITFSYFIGIFAFVALIPYILNTLDLLKISTVIKMLSETITKQNILSAIGVIQIINHNNFLSKIEKYDPYYGTSFRYPSTAFFHHTYYLERPDKDPIEPIIDIMRRSLMNYDYEAFSAGLWAITNQSTRMLDENFDENEEVMISKHILNHLVRVGKLAANKRDEDSTLDIVMSFINITIKMVERKQEHAAWYAITCLEEITIMAAEQKIEEATFQTIIYLRQIGISAVQNQINETAQQAVDSLGNIGKLAVEQKFFKSMMFISDCIKSIGELAAENRYLKTTNEAAKSLEKVGLAAVRDRLDEIAIFTLSNLGEVGIKEAQFNLRGCLAIDSIENIAEAAAEQGLNNVLKKAAVSLKEVGIAAAEQKLDFKTSEVLRLLEKIALKVAKLKLKIVAREVVLNLEKVQIVANQQGLVEAMKQAEMSLKKINETLGKSPSNNT